mgnify:FL=1
MAAKPTIKNTISDAQLKNELIKLFEGGNTDKGKCLEVLGSKYKIQVQRFYQKCNEALIDWQKTKEKATNEAIQANTVEGLKSGLKSKFERQLDLEAMLKDDYRHEDTILNSQGEVIKYFRLLEPKEKILIHAELSKMGGDYAPAKVAETDTDGNDKKSVVIFEIPNNGRG